MEDWIQIIPIVVIVLLALLNFVRKTMRKQQEPQVSLEDEQEVALPPWGNLLPTDNPASQLGMEEELPSRPAEPETASTSQSVESASEAPSQGEMPRPSVAADAASRPNSAAMGPQRDTTLVATIAGIPLSPQTYRQGIILYEILGAPKSRRGSRRSGS